MFKRLSGPTGEIADHNAKPGDSADKIVRSAILVHSGPGGKKTTLSSSNGDISFDEKRIQSVVENHNAMIGQLALQYGGFEKMPIGAYPPILDQHSDDSNDRIRGRLTGLLRFEKRSVPKVGENVACAVCDITFLGGETVEQVLDGRIYHLSVGIDEDTNTLGETSTVIEPAAPGAMVLAKRKSKLKEQKMNKKIARLKKLSNELKTLSAKANDQKKRATLAKRKSEVGAKFTKLMADKKMTPAEFKKVDLVKLAKLDKDSFETVMHVYESRENQIKPGQQGSTSAVNFTEVGTKTAEDREVARFKLAAKKNLSKMGLKFKEMEKEKDEDDKKDLSLGDDDKKDLSGQNMGNDQAAADEASDEVQAKEEMMQQIEENASQIARVASMVEAIMDEMGDEDDEESDLEGDDEDSEMSDDKEKDDDKKDLEKPEDEDKKDLSEGDEKEKDKKDLGKDKEKDDDKKDKKKEEQK